MVEAMQFQGLWSTPSGATPEATLYASILREIKGKDARFKKVDRALFALPSNRVAQEFNFQQGGRYRWTFRWPSYWQ